MDVELENLITGVLQELGPLVLAQKIGRVGTGFEDFDDDQTFHLVLYEPDAWKRVQGLKRTVGAL